MSDQDERMQRLLGKSRLMLNRYETHLRCVSCCGPLVNGRCLACDPRFNEDGTESPDGLWELCGCGDMIPLGKLTCENCRVVDEMVYESDHWGVDPDSGVKP